jgi:anti-sigma factor RsiW
MIDENAQLKLQALLDGELSATDAAEVQAWLGRDAEARSLLGELRNTKAALAGHEASVQLPESREFFWSKIERAIEPRVQRAPAEATAPWFVWLQRQLVPLGGFGMVAVLVAVLVLQLRPATAQFGEIELASDDMGAYTFRDQQQKLTMVWLYDRTDPQLTDPTPLANVDPELQ